MVKALTPTITMTFPADEVDFSETEHVCFTMTQGSRVVIEKSDAQLALSGNVAQVWLSQADTLSLSPGEAKFQLNWTYPADQAGNVARGGSDVHTMRITENLKNEVMA